MPTAGPKLGNALKKMLEASTSCGNVSASWAVALGEDMF